MASGDHDVRLHRLEAAQVQLARVGLLQLCARRRERGVQVLLVAHFWSAREEQYLIYTRCRTSPNRSVGRRSIGRLTSPDFLNWSRLEPMSFGDDGIIPENHLYINKTQPYYRAPHIYLAFPARLMEGRQSLTDQQAREAAREAGIPEERWKDCSETVLMTTRGGTRYDTTFREGFIRPGPGALHWKTRTNYALQGVVPTGEEEMSGASSGKCC